MGYIQSPVPIQITQFPFLAEKHSRDSAWLPFLSHTDLYLETVAESCFSCNAICSFANRTVESTGGPMNQLPFPHGNDSYQNVTLFYSFDVVGFHCFLTMCREGHVFNSAPHPSSSPFSSLTCHFFNTYRISITICNYFEPLLHKVRRV